MPALQLRLLNISGADKYPASNNISGTIPESWSTLTQASIYVIECYSRRMLSNLSNHADISCWLASLCT